METASTASAASSSERITTYRDFYPFYLREHSDPLNRALHYIGTTLVFGVVALSVYLQNYWLLFLMPVMGYGFAWVGHFFVEHNRPATFTYPLWSLLSDYVMYFRFLTGRLGKDLAQAGVK
ncbi:MAG: DUF962 domain-containing protein [bacterium]|nr:DUF962 domain-containing protein [bacterium]